MRRTQWIHRLSRRRASHWLLIFALSFLVFPSSTLRAQKIYRWVDLNGTVHYGQQPPQANIRKGSPEESPARKSAEANPPKEPRRKSLPDESVNPTAIPFSNGLLWEIISPETAADQREPSYILGTIHSEDPRVLQLPVEIQQALRRSTSFCMELLPDLTTSATLAQKMVYANGQTLQDAVGQPLFNQLTPLMSTRGVPEQALMLLKPWAVYMTLSMPQARTGLFLDLLLYEKAKQQGKPICGLETAEEQVAVFEKTPLADQISLLQEIVDHPQETVEQIQKMIPLYLKRDLAALQAVGTDLTDTSAEERRGAEAFLDRLVDERNVRMVERMIPRLEEGATFVAVGALHLPGQRGILQLLANRGYKVAAVY